MNEQQRKIYIYARLRTIIALLHAARDIIDKLYLGTAQVQELSQIDFDIRAMTWKIYQIESLYNPTEGNEEKQS